MFCYKTLSSVINLNGWFEIRDYFILIRVYLIKNINVRLSVIAHKFISFTRYAAFNFFFLNLFTFVIPSWLYVVYYFVIYVLPNKNK